MYSYAFPSRPESEREKHRDAQSPQTVRPCTPSTRCVRPSFLFAFRFCRLCPDVTTRVPTPSRNRQYKQVVWNNNDNNDVRTRYSTDPRRGAVVAESFARLEITAAPFALPPSSKGNYRGSPAGHRPAQPRFCWTSFAGTRSRGGLHATTTW